MTQITLAEGGVQDLPPAARLAGTNCGTPGVWRFEGRQTGPRTVITALVHGNEVCGAVALAPLIAQPPQLERGSLTLVFCNLEAYGRLTDETKSRCRLVDEDLNRVWGRVDTPAAGAETYEMRRARELLPHLQGADVLLDLHSMTDPAPALGLVGLMPRNVAFARSLGFPALLVQDAGHAAGLRLIDRAAFAHPEGRAVAMLVECGEHFSQAAIDAAREAVGRMIEQVVGGETGRGGAAQSVIAVTEAVTIATDEFRFVRDWRNMEVVPDKGTLVARDGAKEVRTPHDHAYMIMPASAAFRKPGGTAVRFGRRVGEA